jgi:hypothetical protein
VRRPVEALEEARLLVVAHARAGVGDLDPRSIVVEG